MTKLNIITSHPLVTKTVGLTKLTPLCKLLILLQFFTNNQNFKGVRCQEHHFKSCCANSYRETKVWLWLNT